MKDTEEIFNAGRLQPGDFTVVGCGGICIDILAAVSRFPQPDEKLRSTDSIIQGGGNVGNCMTAAARLGLRPRILAKIAEDIFGTIIIDELKRDGIDTSFMVVTESGSTAFTYVIVDKEKNTRTCILSQRLAPMDPQELRQSAVNQILDGANILYSDTRITSTALLIAKEAKSRSIPILVDAERRREGLNDLLQLADYVVCSSKFPQAWTEVSTLAGALIEMAVRLPNIKFVIATLGEFGCVMFEKTLDDSSGSERLDVDRTYDLLLQRKIKETCEPYVISSEVGSFYKSSDDGPVNAIHGRLLIGTAEAIPPTELVDTTGSGDAFIGAVLYSLCTKMKSDEMLPFAALVAGLNCRALGARAGLPYRTNPRLTHFLQNRIPS